MKDIHDSCIETISSLRNRDFMPYKTGNLRYNALDLKRKNTRTTAFVIRDSVAPYAKFLDVGTGLYGVYKRKYPIPNAFGRGKTIMHPGSDKHKNFWSEKSFWHVARELERKLDGKIRDIKR